MRIAIFSDVHANLPAFEAYKQHSQGVDKHYFVGDAVGYGGKPNECVEGIKELSDIAVLGNHDAAICGLDDLEDWNPLAVESILKTREIIKSDNYEWLSRLTRQYEDQEFDFCLNHSAPGKSGTNWGYIDDREDTAAVICNLNQRICFIGHTHIPGAFILTNDQIHFAEFPVILHNIKKAIVNVGSVGQPRDYNPNGSYVIYDTKKEVIELHRFKYKINKAMEDIISAGLPQEHAQRLEKGI